MTPKDKGTLRELLQEYGASALLREIAKAGYWTDGGRVWLLKQTEAVKPRVRLGPGWVDGATRWAGE